MFPSHADPLIATARQLAVAGAWRELVVLLAPRADVRQGTSEEALLYAEGLMRSGAERQALQYLLEVEPLLAEDAGRAAHRSAVNMLGAAHLALGDLDAASASFGRALELAAQEDDLLVLARATNNLGAIANMQGDRERALAHYRLAVPTFQRLGQQRGLAACYHNIAITCRDLDELLEADEHERRAIEYATDGGIPRLAAMGRVGRAEIALRQGDPKLAEITAKLAIEEFARLNDRLNQGDACRLSGTACAAQQRYDEALIAFDRALEIAREHGHALVEAETLRDRVPVRLRRGERELALSDARSSIAIFERLGATAECDALRAVIDSLG
jgi:tetratricopeptide (TPR) repeat protein